MSATHRLGDLCKPIRGVTFPSSAARPEPGEGLIACLTTGAVQREVSWVGRRYVPEGVIGSSAQRLIVGDVLVSTANSQALVGKSAQVKDLPEPATFGAFVTVLRPGDRVDRDWFALLLRSPYIIGKFSALASNTTNISNLNIGAALDLEVHVPPLQEQSEVAIKVNSALALATQASSALSSAVDLVGPTLAAFFREAFGAQAPISAGLRDVPGRGSWQPLLALARLESGHTPSRRHPEWWGGDVPWLALPDIRKLHGLIAQDTIEYTNDLGLANSSARMLPTGTVCVSRTASIGFVTMLGKPMATSQDFCNWVCDPNKLDAEFLMYCFMASQDYLRELGSGAVHKTIYMPAIESFHVCAPPLDEQRQIAHRLRHQLHEARRLRTQLAERQALIERLPQRILADAFDAAVRI